MRPQNDEFRRPVGRGKFWSFGDVVANRKMKSNPVFSEKSRVRDGMIEQLHSKIANALS